MEKLSILYVEDEAEIREQMGEFLGRFASTIYLASDGLEGLDLFCRHRPDLVISDIIMPRLDGIGMVKAIRELSPDQAILFTTARSDSEFFIETIELQVDGYIPKPVDLQLLSGKIEKISRQAAMRRDYSRTKTILDEIAHYQRNLIAVLDRDLQPVFLNPRMTEYLGYGSVEAAEQELGTSGFRRHFWQILLQEDSPDSQKEEESDPIKLLRSRDFLTLLSPIDRHRQQFKIDVVHIRESGHTLLALSEITHMVREKLYFEEMASRDILTGLYNRHHFNTVISKKLHESFAHNQPVSLALIDLDRFKRINDLYGHLTGDEVLVEFGRMLRQSSQKQALVCRWGGEEFAILLRDSDIQESHAWAMALQKSLRAHRFTRHSLQISCSIGIAQALPDREQALSELFIRADRALYLAKERGRDRVEVEGE
ncbi:diguanylate cyclase [Nitratifractor sp.]